VESEIIQPQRRNVWFVLRQICCFMLLLGIAGVFFFSGWAKLKALEPFSWNIIDVLPVGITTASVLAHVFIGLEWAIGGWLATHLFLRKITYKATLGLLALFTIYLLVLLAHQGNNGNCGCFGEMQPMKPVPSIIKNIILAVATLILWLLYPARPYRNSMYVALLVTGVAFTAPFVLEPVSIHGSGAVAHEPVVLDSLYTMGHPPPAIDLRRGKHIICFFSTTCPHCIKGAYLVQILHRQYPQFPIFMVLSGGYNAQSDFLEETKASQVPHTLLMNTKAFTAMAGPYVPSILWVNNSIVERKTYYTELEPATIKAWLGK
jgi:hypothetical protein